MTQNQTNKHMRCHVLSLPLSLSLFLSAKYLPASLAKYTFKTETETKSLHFYLYRWEYIGYRNPFIINLSKFTCLIASCQLLPTICFLPLWKKQSYVSIPPSHAQVLIVVKVFAPGTRYVSAVIQMRLATKPLGVISSYSSTGRL